MNWGSWGSNLSSDEMSSLILNTFNSGINCFDHADIYGGYTTEEAFGNAFSKTGLPRENLYYISKCGIMYPSDKLPINTKYYDYSPEHIEFSVNNSLKNLKTEYLDCLLLHRPSPLMEIDEIVEKVQSLINQGKIKAFGVSNFTPLQMDLFKKKIKISFNQINISLTNVDNINNGTLEYMQCNDIIPMAYSPLGSYFKTTNSRLKKIMNLLCKKYNCYEDQLLLSWLLKHPSTIYPVIGSSKAERINLSANSPKINMDTIDWFKLLEASVGKRVP